MELLAKILNIQRRSRCWCWTIFFPFLKKFFWKYLIWLVPCWDDYAPDHNTSAVYTCDFHPKIPDIVTTVNPSYSMVLPAELFWEVVIFYIFYYHLFSWFCSIKTDHRRWFSTPPPPPPLPCSWLLLYLHLHGHIYFISSTLKKGGKKNVILSIQSQKGSDWVGWKNWLHIISVWDFIGDFILNDKKVFNLWQDTSVLPCNYRLVPWEYLKLCLTALIPGFPG